MNRGLLLIAIAIIAIIWIGDADARLYEDGSDGKFDRRGFKSSLLTTARGFGKRSFFEGPIIGSNAPTDSIVELAIQDGKLLEAILHDMDYNLPENPEGAAKIPTNSFFEKQ